MSDHPRPEAFPAPETGCLIPSKGYWLPPLEPSETLPGEQCAAARQGDTTDGAA